MSEFGVAGCQCTRTCPEPCQQFLGERSTCTACGCHAVVADRDHFDAWRDERLCPTVWDHDYMQEGRL